MNKCLLPRMLFLCSLLLVAVPCRSENEKPNILLIVADDLGWGELGCQGNKEIPTPNIDSLAQNGVRFTNAYVSCPVCSPTRAGLLTGRYQQRFGHEFNPGPSGPTTENFGLPLSETILANRLKSAGYTTGMVGKWHLGFKSEYNPTKRGFDEYFGFLGGAHPYFPNAGQPGNDIVRGMQKVDEKEYLTDAFAREATSFIDRHTKDTFFLYLPFNAVHAPLQGAEKYLSRFPNITDQKRKTFAAMLSAMDDAVGAVLSKLRDAKLEEKTLVFFISDNGGPTPQTSSGNGPLRGFKAQVFEGGFRVPMMMQWKSRIPAGRVVENPVIALNITPTSLAAAGVPFERSAFDGVDILPLAEGAKDAKGNDTLYWRFGPQAAIRRGDWKLLTVDGKAWELYNLKDDIGEKTNLATQKPDVTKELQTAWESWNAQNKAPLWKPANRTRGQAQPNARKQRQERRRQKAAEAAKQ